jgi:acyl-CoA thioester hydrolase
LPLAQHEIEIRVRYAETDAMGYLHHSAYFVYFEMGRTEMLRAHGGDYRAMEAAGCFLVVVRLNCRYLKPARYDDLLRLRTTLTNVGAAKLEHAYELFRGDEQLTVANSTLACVDAQGRVQPIPVRFRGQIAP